MPPTLQELVSCPKTEYGNFGFRRAFDSLPSKMTLLEFLLFKLAIDACNKYRDASNVATGACDELMRIVKAPSLARGDPFSEVSCVTSRRRKPHDIAHTGCET
jgi:hypothetical protein